MFAALVVALVAPSVDPHWSDFHSFYDAGLAWRTGAGSGDPRVPLNLNTPALAPLVAPLTVLGVVGAYRVWSMLGLLSLAASLFAIARHRAVPVTRLLWACGGLVVLTPAMSVWVPGQITWLLLYPVTRAWLSASPMRAGLWLVPVVLVKPPLALMVVLLGWRTALVTGVGGALGLAAFIWLDGIEPWLAWAASSEAIAWINYPLNASVFGWAARLITGTAHDAQLAVIGPWGMAACVLAALAALWPVLKASGDRRWLLALVWSLLTSPLGWIYYLPLGLGPMLASWRVGPLGITAIAIFAVPMSLVVGFDAGPVANRIVHSVYAVATLLAAADWMRR